MDGLTEHLQEYWKGYVVLTVCLVPILYLLRKRLLPFGMWSGESVAYMACIHLVLLGIMHTAAWFKQNTRMYWEDKVKPDWHMPLFQIWKYEEFKPRWIFYLELAAAIGIISYMILYRPIRIQKLGEKREKLRKGVAPKARPAGARGKKTKRGRK